MAPGGRSDFEPTHKPGSGCQHGAFGLSCIEYYEVLRTQVHHEDELINDRILWLIQSQTIFLAAYVAIATTKPEYGALRAAIIFVGLALIVLPGIGIKAAIEMMNMCANEFSQHCPALSRGGEGKVLLPGLPMSDRLPSQSMEQGCRISAKGLVPALWMPWLYVAIWFLVLLAWLVFPVRPNTPAHETALKCTQRDAGSRSGASFWICKPD